MFRVVILYCALVVSAFAQAQIFGLQNLGQQPINVQTGTSYTVVAGDAGKIIEFNNAAAVAVSLPTANSTNFTSITFTALNIGAGTVTITPTTSTIAGAATYTLSQYQSAYIVSDGTNYQVMPGKPTGTGPLFSSIGTGTNTSATMTLGAGGTLTFTSTGVVNANQVNGATVPASATVLGSNGSNQLASATTTGSGSVVLATSPTLVTPALGTPSSGVATFVTGLPLSTGVTGILPIANGGNGSGTAPSVGQIGIATSTTVYTPTTVSGDGTLSSAGVLSVTTPCSAATTTNCTLGAALTSGTLTLGGAAETGTLTLNPTTAGNTLNIDNGNWAASTTLNLAAGAPSAGTNAINIGTGLPTGGTTAINIGNASSTATTTTQNGKQVSSVVTETATATIPVYANTVIANCTAACTLTLPAASAGQWITIKNTGAVAGVATIVPASGTIDNNTNMFATNGNYLASGQSVKYVSDGTSWFTDKPIGPVATYPAYVVIANQTANYTIPNSPGVDTADFIEFNQTTANIQFTVPNPTNNLASRVLRFVLTQNTAGITLNCPGTSTPIPMQYQSPIVCDWNFTSGLWVREMPRAVNVQVFTSSGTYTPSPSVRTAIVEIWSSGGTAGSCPATSATTSCSTPGGSAGGAARVAYTWAQLADISSSSITVTVGAAGTPSAAGANAGGNGKTSTFGNGTSNGVTCAGGTGSGAGATNTFSTTNFGANNFSQSGVCTVYTGTVMNNVTGQSATSVGYNSGTNPFFLVSAGGNPAYGGQSHPGVGVNAGGAYTVSSTTSGTCIYQGTGVGWGGSGLFSGISQAAQQACASGAGQIIVTEYF